MSKYQDCLVYVDKNGKYCCGCKVLRLSASECAKLTLLNAGPLTLLGYPTGDTDDPSVPIQVVNDGVTVIQGPGVFKLDLDCAGIDGEVAPEEVTEQMFICQCEYDKSELGAPHVDTQSIVDAIATLCAKVETSNTEIMALCAKILEGNEATASLVTLVEELCEKLAADAEVQNGILEELQALCKKLESLIDIQQESLDILQMIEANTKAITGIETSLGQIGCTEDDAGNITGSVLVCKVSDTTTDPITDTIKVWWFGLDGTVVEDYTGPYVACTNLQALANLLEKICEKLDLAKTVACWKDKFYEGGLDNTFTNFTHTNQVFTVIFDNGDVDTFTVPSATGWTDQVTQMAAGLGSIMPWAQSVGSFFAPNGGGGLPAPEVPLNQMVARYVSFRVCPGDKLPVNVEYKSDQRTTSRSLVVQYVETDTIYIDRCVDCFGNATYFRDGEPYAPVCAIPCEESFPEIPESTCSITYLDGCDNVGSENSDDWVTIIRSIQNCEDGPRLSYLIADEDGGLVDYELVGDFVNCSTGDLIPEPQEPAEFEFIECCDVPEGAVDYDRYCRNLGGLLEFTPDEGEDCKTRYVVNGVDVNLPDGAYTEQDTLDALNGSGMGGDWTIFVAQDGSKQLCSAEPIALCFHRQCFVTGGPIIGEFTRLCPIVNLVPAGAVVCRKFLLTMDKNSFPIAQSLANIEGLMQDANTMASDSLIKDCLLLDAMTNEACDAPLSETFNKESGELCLEGDVVSQYNSGATIALKDSAGNLCGEAIVADDEPPAVFTEAEEGPGKTTVKITDCELAEGKTPVQIKAVKPVLQATVGAVKAVVKNMSILQAKTLVKAQAIKTPVKEPITEK